ncbi:O-acetylhomoserine aminocarboxypropyltransferase/cysteine synthase [Herbivorax sp. ANBcel31]|uniref:O-acetylhomoserine aminocarboxypropyltransferase/cysteine synthase family protein n=1 Tax=Herbivorax sp. ANBcel31 TaxID=3069754 RepID=UPI0027AFAE0C|nr:O-acetylhomoserine aminocarboxypropyltransferase/cysteine synthase family protein [Herbivorax sp. ANBcel31]MDQ2085449.1 O-acetylhomoserine aminocarboxypropyltransferase/cysteine synthase [Herbivorax sp. ANBcel31]
MKFNTALLHGNFKCDEKTGATVTPIYQSTSFEQKSPEKLENIFKGSEPGFIYSRISNPTVDSFEKRIAFLEGGVGAVACSSGMAAITLALLNILKSGEEIVSGSGVFGGTHSLFKSLNDYGILTRYVEDSQVESFEKAINEKTRLIFIETIGNPKLDVPDIRELSKLANSKGIPLIVDNTVTTPYLVRPLKLGADIVVHSTSKYINGSGNTIGGIIVDGGSFKWDFEKYNTLKEYKKFGVFTYLAKLKKGLFKDFGACLSPFNAYLNSIGLETLGIRMERLCKNAQKLAVYLEKKPKVIDVNYPGLKNSRYFKKANEQFDGKFGAILTIRVGTRENAFKLINSLKFVSNLANIGDVRTLVIHPASTIYVTNTNEEQEMMGVYEDLLRISVGIEDIEDIKEDFNQGLNNL